MAGSVTCERATEEVFSCRETVSEWAEQFGFASGSQQTDFLEIPGFPFPLACIRDKKKSDVSEFGT